MFGTYALKELEIAWVGTRPNIGYGIMMDKLNIEKDHHPTCTLMPRNGMQVYHLGKKYDSMILFKPASTKSFKNSH